MPVWLCCALPKGFIEVQAVLALWDIPVLPSPPAWSRQELMHFPQKPWGAQESLKQAEEEDELSH